ncbi:MAG: hypothetical protein AB8B56_14050 [Crocinitomicaceae bacterium]
MKNTSKASIIISCIAILAAIWAQYQLYDGYQSASGKTRALYGLRHWSYMWFALLGCISLILFVLSIFSKEKLKVLALTLLLAVGSIILLINPVWRWFI